MDTHKKTWIILTFIVLLLGIFGYSYYATLNRILKQPSNSNPGIGINYKFNNSPVDDGKGVSNFPSEEIVTPSTLLTERIKSINTEKIIETKTKVPEEIVNFNKNQVSEFFSDYDTIQFSKENIIIEKYTPYLPDYFIVKLEGNLIKVFKTDSEGRAIIFDDFEALPQKNKDENLEKGIEVKTLEDVYRIIGDYE